MHDSQPADFEQPDGVVLAELFSPPAAVFPSDPGDGDIGDLVSAGIAQHAHVGCPRGRLVADQDVGVVIVMRVRDEDGVGGQLRREVVAEPHMAGERIDEEARTARRVNAKAGVGDGLDSDLSPL